MLRLIAMASVVVSCCLGSTASADVVPPEPTNCPTGSVGRTCHGGPYCGVNACPLTGSCQTGTSCQTAQLCVVQFDCDGMAGPHYVDKVTATCTGGTACATGTCKTVSVCLPATAKPDAKVWTEAGQPARDGKVTAVDGKVAAVDRKVSPTEAGGTQADSTAAKADSASGPAASRDGCNCELQSRRAGAGALAGLFALVVIVLGLRRRRRV